MIADTPAICLARAAASRTQAEDATLENVREKLLLSAAAWDDLAGTLLGRACKNLQIRPQGGIPRPRPIPGIMKGCST
jgi:hypothetical protein